MHIKLISMVQLKSRLCNNQQNPPLSLQVIWLHRLNYHPVVFAPQMQLLFRVLALALEVVQSIWMMWPVLDQRLSWWTVLMTLLLLTVPTLRMLVFAVHWHVRPALARTLHKEAAQREIEYDSINILSASPSLTHYSAELPLRVWLIRAL